MRARQTAYKVWISDLINGKYVKGEGEWDSNYILIKDKKVSRVNLIGTVSNVFQNSEQTFSSLIVEDGSGSIRVKAWRDDVFLINKFKVGDLILLIGRIREYNEEPYVTPEIGKKLDNLNWDLVRKIELFREYQKPIRIENQVKNEGLNQEVSEEIIGSQSDRQKILQTIEKLDSEDGVDFDSVVIGTGIVSNKVHNLIEELIKEGEIFKVGESKLKIMK